MLVLATAAAKPPPLLEVAAGDTIPVTIAGQTLAIVVHSGSIDRLTLDGAVATRIGIQPATLMGKANLKFGGSQVLKGHNRPIDHTTAGIASGDRVLWFDGLDTPAADGSIGPWALPHDRVALRLPGAGRTSYSFPLVGDRNSQSLTVIRTPDYGFGLTFAAESRARLPIASAAAGAAIARALGGTARPDSWEEEVMLGIRRPVRRVDLAQPLVIGPFRFTSIAVRIRDARDAMGSGDALPLPPSDDDDPSEIVVTATKTKGPQPIRTLTIPGSALAACSRIEFAKTAKLITLTC
ncbi:MAG: hypothetical protein CFE37_06635 [Alphaproteobacteria bacterium PA4]|nr:MAG: hypothetical protein CFE37_06635 [Alphaproteobacteria bacterium PA4]